MAFSPVTNRSVATKMKINITLNISWTFTVVCKVLQLLQKSISVSEMLLTFIKRSICKLSSIDDFCVSCRASVVFHIPFSVQGMLAGCQTLLTRNEKNVMVITTYCAVTKLLTSKAVHTFITVLQSITCGKNLGLFHDNMIIAP